MSTKLGKTKSVEKAVERGGSEHFLNLNSIYVSGLIVKQTFLFSGF